MGELLAHQAASTHEQSHLDGSHMTLEGTPYSYCHSSKMQSICFQLLEAKTSSVSHKIFRIYLTRHLILVIQPHSAGGVLGVGGNVLRFVVNPSLY